MPTYYESLKTFVAHTKDLELECDAAKGVVAQINESCRDTLGLELNMTSWRDYLRYTPPGSQTIQDHLLDLIRQVDIFILILYKRYGTITGGHSESNIVREVNLAINRTRQADNLIMLSYFRELSDNEDPGTQEAEVRSLRQRLKEEEGVFARNYSTVEEFRELLTHDLYCAILKHRFNRDKERVLRKFWNFAVPERSTYPLLAIVYPSMNRAFMGKAHGKGVWNDRLVPNIVFEDHKALQKVERSLHEISFGKFRIYNSLTTPDDIQYMNRLWICLPRSSNGLAWSQRYKERSRFVMLPRKPHSRGCLHWRRSSRSTKYIQIASPLALYLREQRKGMPIDGEWLPQMEKMIAKDFAVLARFDDTISGVATKGGFLKDYFIAGIRGLGTWGAAWYIDRKFTELTEFAEQGDIQLLLEVEYRDGRIVAVRDVSDKPQSYFDNQSDPKTVKKIIKEYEKGAPVQP